MGTRSRSLSNHMASINWTSRTSTGWSGQRVAAMEAERQQTHGEFEEARARWGSHVEAAERAAESVRPQLIPPAELDAMRVQLVEEAVAPWREQCKALSAEGDAARAAASTSRRELEALRAAHETAAHTHQAALREADTARETVACALPAMAWSTTSAGACRHRRGMGITEQPSDE